MRHEASGPLLRGWFDRFWQVLQVLLRVMVPVFLLVSLLEAVGAIEAAGRWLGVPLEWVGIGPRAAVALAVGLFANLYAAIGSMASLGLSPAEALPVVLFLQFAHALPIEAAVARQAGVGAWRYALIRGGMGAAAAAAAPLLARLAGLGVVPAASAPAATAAAGAPGPVSGAVGFGPVLLHSLGSLGETLLLLVAVLAPLTLAIQLLEQWGWLERWSRAAEPWMRRVGWSGEAAFPLLIGLFVGLVYGAGVMIERCRRGRLDRRVAWELFIFLGACHSVLEDPFIFLAVGVGPGLLVPSRILAGAAVLLVLAWRERARARHRVAPSVHVSGD